MKILVTGAKGQLGSELQLLSKKHPDLTFLFTEVDELDITNKQALSDYFQNHRPDVCINCAAYTAVDKAEEEKEFCDLINITGSQNVAAACQKAGVVLVHISTDFIFDGNACRPLRETEPAQPVNYYGRSKLLGEKAVTDVLDRYFIIRTSWLFSSFGNNFVKTMLRLAETKDKLQVITDQIGTPTYARDLATVILENMIRSKKYGIYNYSNEGIASWYDFAAAIFEYAYMQTRVEPLLTEQYPTAARRPHYSVLDKTKIKSTFQLEIPHWRESLRKCLKEL